MKKGTAVIAGGTGLIGSRLSVLLRQRGYEVLHLSRRRDMGAEFPAYQWSPANGTIEEEAIRSANYIVNLAGAPIAEERWTPARKRLIVESREQSALLLKQAIEQFGGDDLRAYVGASGMGYYGDRGEALRGEDAAPGQSGFLPETVQRWEAAHRAVAQSGVRTVILRIGLVLSVKGGALPKMLLPFRFFLGVYFGNGRQWYSWIHLDDLCRVFLHAIENEQITGAYNTATPTSLRNKDFVRTLRTALEWPSLLLPAPAFALRLMLGELADAVLDSDRLKVDKLLHSGFEFHYPDLLAALRDLRLRRV